MPCSNPSIHGELFLGAHEAGFSMSDPLRQIGWFAVKSYAQDACIRKGPCDFGQMARAAIPPCSMPDDDASACCCLWGINCCCIRFCTARQ